MTTDSNENPILPDPPFEIVLDVYGVPAVFLIIPEWSEKLKRAEFEAYHEGHYMCTLAREDNFTGWQLTGGDIDRYQLQEMGLRIDNHYLHP